LRASLAIFQHVVGAFDRRAEVLDPLSQSLHELEELGRAVAVR